MSSFPGLVSDVPFPESVRLRCGCTLGRLRKKIVSSLRTFCVAQRTPLGALWWAKREGNPKKRRSLYPRGWFTLLCCRNPPSSIKQLQQHSCKKWIFMIRLSDSVGLGCSSLVDLHDSTLQPEANHCLQDQLPSSRLLGASYEEMTSAGHISLPLVNSHFRCLERLQPAYQVTFPGQEPTVKKGRVCPIEITLAQRASNKKVIFKRYSIWRWWFTFLPSSSLSDVIGDFQIGLKHLESCLGNTYVSVTGLGSV